MKALRTARRIAAVLVGVTAAPATVISNIEVMLTVTGARSVTNVVAIGPAVKLVKENVALVGYIGNGPAVLLVQ